MSLEAIQARDVGPGDLPGFILRHAEQDAFQDLTRARERRFGVGVVGAPHELIDANEGAVADAKAVPWRLRKAFLRKKSLGSASVLKRYQPSRRARWVYV